jgi:Tol biopolymer transport system component
MWNSGDARAMLGWRGAVMAMAVTMVAGCTTTHTTPPVASQSSATAAPTVTVAPVPTASPADDLDAFPPTAPLPAAPVVNVFGELDGVPRGTARPIGDEGFKQHSFADEGYDADVVVDPSGKWMCFASTRNGTRSALYLQRTDGTTVTRLTSDDSENAFPAFSPDGKQIAFSSTRTGVWNIYTMDTDGRNVVTVTTGNAQCVHPSFSPDGTRIVYSSLGTRSRQWELWVKSLNTGEPQQVGYGLFPSWCPARNGVDRIAFQRARERGSRWFSLWTLDLVDGEPRHVTEVAVSSNAAIVSPTWSPDGQRLAFATVLDPTHPSGLKKARGEQDIWTVAADGTDRRRLTDGNGVNLSPCWANDGRVYFVSNRGGNENIWSVRPEAGRTFTAAGTPATPSATAKPNTVVPPDAAAGVDTGR